MEMHTMQRRDKMSHTEHNTQTTDHSHELPAGHFHHMEPEQAYHGAKLGMWLFLATEVHLFGALFCVFAFYRWKFLDLFNNCAQSLNWKMGLTNTIVLLTSSYFMVRGVDAAQKGDNKKVVTWVDLTTFCGLIFFVVKFFEYKAKFEHTPPILPSTNVFYGIYFTMTGIHGLHVLIGLGLMLWLRILARKNRFTQTYYTPVEIVGLYWHLVDVVWIYLFPVLYLLGGISSHGH